MAHLLSCAQEPSIYSLYYILNLNSFTSLKPYNPLLGTLAVSLGCFPFENWNLSPNLELP